MEISYFFKRIFRGFFLPLNFLICKQELFYLCAVHRPKDLQLGIFSQYLPVTPSNCDWCVLVWVWLCSATGKFRNYSSGCTSLFCISHVLLTIAISATDSDALGFPGNSTKKLPFKIHSCGLAWYIFLFFLILAKKSDKHAENS